FEIFGIVDIQSDPFVLEKPQRQTLSRNLTQMVTETIETKAQFDDVRWSQQKRVGSHPIMGRHQQREGRRRRLRDLSQNLLDVFGAYQWHITRHDQNRFTSGSLQLPPRKVYRARLAVFRVFS